MSFTSVLSTIGKDIKGVFAWVGSAKGQAVIQTGENVAITAGTIAGVGPLVTGAVGLFNTFATEAIKVETLAAAAGTQDGTGSEKAAAVILAVTPAVLSFAKQYGLSDPTAAQIAAANSAVVAFLNSFGVEAPAPVAAVPVS